jgi:hypothetical protein
MTDSTINDPVRLGEAAAAKFVAGSKRTQAHIEPMAKGLLEAKRRYPHTGQFGEWLIGSPYNAIGKDDRAALIRLGEIWSDDLRRRIEATTMTSPDYIWDKLCKPSAPPKPDNVSADDAAAPDPGLYPARITRTNESWDTVDPRLVRALLQAVPSLRRRKIWEPAAGAGLMAGQLHMAGCSVILASDIAPRGDGVETLDMMAVETMPGGPDAIVTNPPWGDLAAPFIRHALELAEPKRALVAMLVPLPWITAAGVADMTGNPALEALVIPRFRAKWMTAEEEARLANGPASPKMNHIWIVWDFNRDLDLLPAVMFVDPPKEETSLLAAE